MNRPPADSMDRRPDRRVHQRPDPRIDQRPGRQIERRTIGRAVVGALGGLLLGGPVAAVVVGIVTVAVPIMRANRRSGRIRRERHRALPLTLDILVVAIEAGLTPHQAMQVLASTAPPALRPTFAHITTLLQRGVTFADAIGELRTAVGPTAAPAADALAIAHRHGTPLRDTIGLLAADAARQRQLHASAAARRLPVLLSFPLVVCVLPAFALIAIAPAVIAAVRSFSAPAW